MEKEYILYEKRIRSYSLWVFLVLHSVVTLVNITLLLSTSEVGNDLSGNCGQGNNYISISICVKQHPKMVYFDVVLYFLSTLWIVLVLSINFREELVENRSWVAYVTSVIAVMTLVVVGKYQNSNNIAMGVAY